MRHSQGPASRSERQALLQGPERRGDGGFVAASWSPRKPKVSSAQPAPSMSAPSKAVGAASTAPTAGLQVNQQAKTHKDRRGSDAVAYDTMMQLSAPRNPLQHAAFRTFVVWITTSAILFLTNQLATLPVGFFPSYAQEKMHFSSAQITLFFSVYPLCIMISSPLAALVCPIVGRQTAICVGMVLSGVSTIAFAYTSTAAAAFLLRILQGLGAGAAVVGAFSMISEEYSESVGHILLVQEGVVAAAFVTAPPLGSILFQYQGFQMPFLASGVAQLLVVMLVPVLFIEYTLPDGMYSSQLVPSTPPPSASENRSASFRDVLTPTCVMCLVLTVFAMASFGFVDPFLGAHMHAVLGAQHVAVGFGFALSALVYFLGGVIHMWLSRVCGFRTVILFGLLQLSLGFFFLGPPPFMTVVFENTTGLWTTQWLSLAFIGCGSALCIAPGLPLSLASVTHTGSNANNLVIGLFSAAIYFGQVVGPFLAFCLMQLLPSTTSQSCFTLHDSPKQCTSSLPWTFTTYSFVLLVLLGVVAWRLPAMEEDSELLASKQHPILLPRQPSEYGQFVFFADDSMDEDELSSSSSQHFAV